MITTLMTKTTMPVHVITKSSGEYDNYFEFFRDIDMLIDSKRVSDNEKLQYLKQYNGGKPHKINRACLHLAPREGYQKARSELENRYGNKERIASTYKDKVLAWPEMKEENVEMLDDFIIELDSCISAMSGIHCGLLELQNPRTLRQLVGKLPRYLQDRWRRIADEITENGRLQGIKYFVKFLEKENSRDEGGDEATATAVVTNQVDDSRVQVLSSQLKGSVGGTTAIPVQVELNDKVVDTRYYLDNGSSVTFCSKNLLKKLGVTDMNYQPPTLQVSTMIGTKGMFYLNVEGMSVAEVEGNNQVRLLPVFAVNKLPLSQSHSIRKNDIEKWEHLRKLEFDHIEGEVEIMVGSNVPEASEPWEVVHAEKVGDPYTVRTRLGKNLLKKLGVTDMNYQPPTLQVSTMIGTKGMFYLNVEGMSVGDVEGNNQVACREGRRSVYCENTFRYKQFMINLLEKGYAEKVPTCDVKNQQIWCIPHFGVRHPTKSNKVRVVLDCAARVNDLSLNYLLRQGPDISNLLLGVLRFRLRLHAYTADIETMYYQVKVPESDRDYLRFLWWKEGQIGGDIFKLRMTSHPFSASCSPGIANCALKRVVLDYGSQFHTSVSEIVLNNFYVDDLLVSSDDINDLIDTSVNVIDLCRKDGFNLTKFNSNSFRFMNSLSKEKCSDSVEQLIRNKDMERKTLGLNLSLIQDKISISLNVDAISSTKRELLAVIGNVYDPLGMLAPVVLEGRILLQNLFREGIGWDCSFTEPDKGHINAWMSRLNRFKVFIIDRCTKKGITSEVESIQCHIFYDSSELAYGSVAYLGYKHVDDKIQCSFILGKAKVAPLKPFTIPRLELVAATLAIKLKNVIVGHMERQAVLNQLRQKYWVIKGNSAVRKVLSKCVTCRRFKSPRITQEMASLPVARANVNQRPERDKCFYQVCIQTGYSDHVTNFIGASKVENTINSRPLTVISSDVDDFDTSVVILDNQEMLCESRKKWRQVEYLAREFWRRWQLGYLPCLQEHQKWLKINRDLKEGDVVLMVENNTPRSHWLLAKVVRSIESKDGLIIQVEEARGKRLYKRPISKLILLLEGDSR
ncbi:uncharacterized protein LOC143017993 [Oratosquilla oratoria]|uniref:uncharacterized protein LOC143017993 n=1 Tax=Oratosquilla oratoria TaxID=337810 RepID=UPI003F769A5D